MPSHARDPDHHFNRSIAVAIAIAVAVPLALGQQVDDIHLVVVDVFVVVALASILACPLHAASLLVHISRARCPTEALVASTSFLEIQTTRNDVIHPLCLFVCTFSCSLCCPMIISILTGQTWITARISRFLSGAALTSPHLSSSVGFFSQVSQKLHDAIPTNAGQTIY